MKDIRIYILGKQDYKFNMITSTYYLNYKEAVIKRVSTEYNRCNRNRAELMALYRAIQKVKEPCNIEIISKVDLEFNKPKRSNNKDLLVAIITIINKSGHIIKCTIDKEMNQVNLWEQLYNNTVDNVFKHNNHIEDEENDDYMHDRWRPGSGGY